MKKLRIGRRRGRVNGIDLSPLELALYPALSSGRWDIPDRFNFARDVVEGLADDPRRRAVTFIGKDGIIEPRTFHVVAEHAARWSWLLRERGVRNGDPVLVLMSTSVDWLEVALACMKVGAILVPGSATLSAETLDVWLERTGAEAVVADRAAQAELSRTTNRPLVLYVDEAKEVLAGAPDQAPSHDSSARDIAFILPTPGTAGTPRLVGHSHGAVFAARVAAEHWLDAGRGDAVLCTAEPGSAESIWHTLVGPWSRGAELLLHDGAFEPLERLDLVYRLGVTVLCQTPAEYAALSQLHELGRFRPPQLRRLVSTGEYLDPAVAEVFENVWGLPVHDGYGQAETNVVITNGADAGFKAGSLGTPLPGHQVAVIDEQGNELPPDVEGEIAVRGRPPTLFAGYWESPEQTKQAFRGDWYATGDLATVDRDGFFWFVSRASDVILSRGERFGPYDAERALRTHEKVVGSAVVGIRDLERGGQFVRAFVVLAPGVEGSDQLEAELRHEIGAVLREHEVPREIEFVDELPTTPGRKLRRLELRERLVVGRPLWDKPSAEDEAEHDPWAGMLDPWPTHPADAAGEAAAGPLPDYVVEPTEESERAPEVETELPEAPTVDALPDYVVEPEPGPEIFEPTAEVAGEAEADLAAAPPADPTLEATAVEEPVVEVGPFVEVEPEPIAEAELETEPAPVAEVLPGPTPVPQPPQIPVPDPEPPTEPDPEPAGPDLVPELEPQPEPPDTGPIPDTGPLARVVEEVEKAEPEIEPVALDVPETPEALAEPDDAHATKDEPQPAHRPEFGLAAVEPDAVPMSALEGAWAPVLDPPPPPDPEPEPEPDPEPAPEPEPEPAAVAEADPATLPDYVVEPSAAAEAPPPAPRSEMEVEPGEPLTADSILTPKPPPGPLPDFIVDPDHRAEDPLPPLRVAGSTSFPPSEPAGGNDAPRESLGLPPLTDFPSPRSFPGEVGAEETGAASEPKRGRESRRRDKHAPPPSGKRGRRERSSGEPGDMQESVDWAGLSSRLSAYSLSQTPAAEESGVAEPEASGEDAAEPDETEDT